MAQFGGWTRLPKANGATSSEAGAPSRDVAVLGRLESISIIYPKSDLWSGKRPKRMEGKLRRMLFTTVAALFRPYWPDGRHAITILCMPMFPKVYALALCRSSNTVFHGKSGDKTGDPVSNRSRDGRSAMHGGAPQCNHLCCLPSSDFSMSPDLASSSRDKLKDKYISSHTNHRIFILFIIFIFVLVVCTSL